MRLVVGLYLGKIILQVRWLVLTRVPNIILEFLCMAILTSDPGVQGSQKNHSVFSRGQTAREQKDFGGLRASQALDGWFWV